MGAPDPGLMEIGTGRSGLLRAISEGLTAVETVSNNGCYDKKPLPVNYLDLQGARQDERPLRVRASSRDPSSAGPDPLSLFPTLYFS